MTPSYPLIRLYERQFSNPADKDEFIHAIEWIKGRISSVQMEYQIHQSETDPLRLYEIWFYPDEQTMEWVQQAMEGALAVPRKFDLKTSADTLTFIKGFAVEDN